MNANEVDNAQEIAPWIPLYLLGLIAKVAAQVQREREMAKQE